MPRIARPATVAALVVAAAAPAAALAAAPAPGRWRGKLDKYTGPGSKVSFVVGRDLTKFHIPFAPLFCVDPFDFTNSHVEGQTVYVPRAAIRGGRVKTTYKIRDKTGREIGRVILKATLRGRAGKGTVTVNNGSCSVTDLPWHARHA